jgi:hypothetical protein
MGRWIVALPLLVAGISIGDGRAASADPIAKTMAGGLATAQGQPAQTATTPRKSVRVLRYKHSLARNPKSPAHDPLLTVLAKAPPTLPATGSVVEDGGALRPHSVNTIRVPAPVSAPSATSQAPASSEEGVERDQDKDRDLEDIVALADNHGGTKSPQIWLRSPIPSVALTTTELMELLATCCVAAICIYGLVSPNSERRSRLGLLRSPRRGRARPSSSKPGSRADRLARRRLFPHQFGPAIQSQ